MLLEMQTQNSKMSFDLDPDAIGELIQAAFRYALNMAQLQPGWSEEIVYQEGQRAWDGRGISGFLEGEESTKEGTSDLSDEEMVQDATLCQAETETEHGKDLEDRPEQMLDPELMPGSKTEPGQCRDSMEPAEGEAQSQQDAQGMQGAPNVQAEEEKNLSEKRPESRPEGQSAYSTDRKQDWAYPYIQEPDATKGYKGFLLIKCQHCGKMKGFCAKKPMSSYICDCGGETQLNRMQEADADCECGKRWIYKTNADDAIIEVNCIACGNPIDMSYNPRRHIYKTIQESRRR